MATFGKTPDPLSPMKLAISDLETLHDDAMRVYEDLNASWAVDARKTAQRPQAERREYVRAEIDREKLPTTRFGEYPE
jgi:hypothetical protein